MEKPKVKLWLVKKEVLAKTLREAITKPGRVYEIQEASKEYQPEEKPKKVGFTK